MGANIKINASTEDFTQQIKAMQQQMRELKSQYDVARISAQVLGNEMGVLEATEKQLTSTMDIQRKMIAKQTEKVEELENKLKDTKKKQEDLTKEIQQNNQAIQEAIEIYGRDSEEVKELEEKQRKLQEKLDKCNNSINSQENQLSRARVTLNNYRTQLGRSELELQNVREEMENLNETVDDSNETVDENVSMWTHFSESAENIQNGLASIKDKVMDLTKSILGLTKECVNFYDEYNKAVNKYAMKTQATKEQTQEFGDTLKEVYSEGYGESFEQLADSATLINQQLEVSGDELGKVVRHADSFRSVFDYEANESIRSVSMLMQQFGLTAEQAFNLIVQGEQQGLDFSGELLDSINEYSVHFSQLGLDAEGMFNIFLDGSKSGAFNLDKIGDAVKELGIRIKEGSGAEALQQLGLNADEIAKKFNKGGKEAQEAFYQIFGALGKVQDQQELNSLGTALMGTMFEDLGKKAVIAFGDMSDGFNKNADSMQQIDDMSFDNFQSGLTALKRTLQMQLLEPLEEELMPKFKDFFQKIKDNMPQIKEKVSDVINFIIDKVTWIIDNKDWIIPLIAGITGAFTALNIVIGIATIAWGLMALSEYIALAPILLIVLGVGLIIAAIVALVLKWDWVKEKWNTFTQALSEKWDWFVEKIKGAGSVIKNFFIDLGEAIANLCIGGVNNVIDLLNKLSFDVPDWVPLIGGKHFGFEIDHVNYVSWNAKGGIFDKPTIFNTSSGLQGVGEAGAEAIIPLDTMYKNLDSIVTQRIKENNQQIYVVVNAELDGDSIASKTSKRVEKRISKKQQQNNIAKGVVRS